jgi:hypothetical protein
MGLRLANGLALLWVFRSYFREGLTWLRTFLGRTDAGSGGRRRAMALAWAAHFAARLDDRSLASALRDRG